MKQSILVLAPDYHVFRVWCHRNGVNPGAPNLAYVDDERRLRGVLDPLVLRLNGWGCNPCYTPQFAEILRSRGRKAPTREIDEKEALDMLREAGHVRDNGD